MLEMLVASKRTLIQQLIIDDYDDIEKAMMIETNQFLKVCRWIQSWSQSTLIWSFHYSAAGQRHVIANFPIFMVGWGGREVQNKRELKNLKKIIYHICPSIIVKKLWCPCSVYCASRWGPFTYRRLLWSECNNYLLHSHPGHQYHQHMSSSYV